MVASIMRWALSPRIPPAFESSRPVCSSMADLRIGTFLAPNIMPVYEAVTEALGRRLGLTTELVVETSYDSCLDDVNDLCFVCSLPYVEFERQGLAPAEPVAAPVLSEPRYQGRPIYFSDVIVPAASDAARFLDLRDRTWSYNEPRSHSGYGITRYHLLRLGETDGFFEAVIEAGFHETSIELVRRGEVDGSAIDSQVLSVALRDDPGLRHEIRIVDTLGPSTIQPVAVSKRIDDELRRQMVDVIVGLHNDPSVRRRLDHGLVDRFVAVGPADYDDIRLMLEACEAAGFTVLR